MRALAAKFVTIDNQTGLPLTGENGQELTTPLSGEVRVRHAIDVSEQRRRPLYLPFANNSQIGRLGGFTSLHRAKNAVRRHFGIESRRMMRWEETVR